ncbi:unnamed protein product [Diamesa serratosioi]
MGFGEILNCIFENKNDDYTCYVTSLDNSNNTMVITGSSGTHEANKTNIDIESIYVENTNTKFIPRNLGNLFNLIKLTMRKTKLVEIKSQDFNGMQDLEYLDLSENYLTILPIDVFLTLPKLELLSMLSNQLKEIQNGIFSNNLQLRSLHLSFNEIKFLGSSLLSGLTNLGFVNLWSNFCINNMYEGAEAIIELRNVIQRNCINPNEVPQMTTTENVIDALTIVL